MCTQQCTCKFPGLSDMSVWVDNVHITRATVFYIFITINFYGVLRPVNNLIRNTDFETTRLAKVYVQRV